MSDFQFKQVETGRGFRIVTATPKAGDVHPHDIPEGGLTSVAFLVSGKAIGLSSTFETVINYNAKEVFSDPRTNASGPAAIGVVEGGKYFCVLPREGFKIQGELQSVPKDYSVNLEQGDRLFVVEGAMSGYQKGAVIYKESHGVSPLTADKESFVLVFKVIEDNVI